MFNIYIKKMKLKNFLINLIREDLNNQNVLNENTQLINQILDKLNKYGKDNLSFDEKKYLSQYSNNNVDINLEKWLLSDDEDTFSYTGDKLLYDEFETDEDIFYNVDKLKRVISKHLGKTPFTNNADWGGGDVWNLKSDDNFKGTFFYLDDNELLILKRDMVDDEYEDEVIKTITTATELYTSLKDTIKSLKMESKSTYLNEEIGVNSNLWYHGGDSEISKFETVPPINRRGNVDGFYFTHFLDNAKNYGDLITVVKLKVNKPFILGKTVVSDEMVTAYEAELHNENKHLPIGGDWIKTKSEYFKEKSQMPYTGMSGDAQQRVYKVGGFDSVIDGHEIAVFDSNNIIILKTITNV